MADFLKLKLSESINGKQIPLTATNSPGTAIHTAVSGTTSMDEVWLYVTNNHSSDLNLTIQWGGTTSPDDSIQMMIPSKTGLYLIVPGLVLQNGQVIRGIGQTAGFLSISGWVNRIVG